MRAPDALVDYVRDALAQGHDRTSIARAAQSAGWSAPETEAALTAWVDAGSLPPVPRPRDMVTARDALRHGVMFLTLLIVAFNLVDLVFALIDAWIADPLDPSTAQYSGIRWSVAGLIVATPIWGWLMLSTARETDRDLGRRRSVVERWVTSAAMFLAAATLIGNATNTIASFLGGDLSTRFVLKSLWSAIVSGTIFAYYVAPRAALEADTRSLLPRARAMVAAVAATAVVVIALGIWVAGSPSDTRRERRDQMRLATLREIGAAVQCHSARPGVFTRPTAIADLDPACLSPDRLAELTASGEGSDYAISYPAPTTAEICTAFENTAVLPASNSFDPARGCGQFVLRSPR